MNDPKWKIHEMRVRLFEQGSKHKPVSWKPSNAHFTYFFK